MFDGQEHIPKLLPCSHTICLECLTRCGNHPKYHHHQHHHHIITPINIITSINIIITPINIIPPINTIPFTNLIVNASPPASSNRLLSYHPVLSYQLYFLHFPEKDYFDSNSSVNCFGIYSLPKLICHCIVA